MGKTAKKLSAKLEVADNPFAILPRPPYGFDLLPPRFRWESTRRHPYYLTYWKAARSAHRHDPSSGEAEELMRIVAIGVLRSIGIGSEPVDPATIFDDMEAGALHCASLTGCVQPLTVRQLIGLLLDSLPKEVLNQVGLRMFEAACSDDSNSANPMLARVRLATMGRELDAFPVSPYVWVNPAASSRQVIRDISELLKGWKKQYGLTERRERSDRDYCNYLEVWDVREGWIGHGYDGSRERTLKSIASDRKTSLATISSQYRNAFEMITGHRYTPEMWLRVFGLTKLSALWSDKPGQVAARRPQKSKTRRPVPESVLKRSDTDDRVPLTAGLAATSPNDGSEAWQRISAIIDLANQGRSDSEIAAELELSETTSAYLPRIRERFCTRSAAASR